MASYLLSPAQAAKVQSKYASMENKLARVKAKAEIKAGEIKDGLEIVGTASLMGFLRGRMEKDGKGFVIPGTQIDIELVTGMALAGAGLMDAFGKFDQDAMMIGYGCLAHYMGQVGRTYGRTGEFSIVAGEGVMVGALPPQMSII